MNSELVNAVNAHPADNSAAMLADYLTLLQQSLDAYKVTWYAAYRGEYGRRLWQTQLMHNWKVVDTAYQAGFEKDLAVEAKRYYAEAKKHGSVDPQVTHSVNHAGKTRIQRIDDAISRSEWQSHWMRKWLLADGVGERMVGAFTLSDSSESIFLVDRQPDRRPFSDEDAEDFYQILISFPRLHYWLFLERGLIQPASHPFSPREREVVQLLLGPLTEVAIAEKLELSKGTLHNYVRAICKNLDVKSRYQLVQLWLQSVPFMGK